MAATQRPRTIRDLLRRFRSRQLNSKRTEILVDKSETKCDSAIHIIESLPTSLDSPSELPSTQRALIVASKGTYALSDSHPLPEVLSPTDVLIKPHAIGLSPIGWKSVSYNFCLPSFPWITGRECAGTVVEVHPSITHIKKGDRVWTSTYYRDVRAGCFQEFVVVPQHTILKMPERVRFEDAACLGVPGG